MTVTFSANEVPPASKLNDLAALAPVYARKTSDETVTSSAVLQNDNNLVLPVAASTVYEVEMHLIWQAIAAADIGFDWSTPAGVSGFYTATGPLLTSSALFLGALAWTSGGQFEGTGANVYSRMSGLLVVGATAGNLQFRWAQVTSNATGTIARAHSWLRLHRIA